MANTRTITTTRLPGLTVSYTELLSWMRSNAIANSPFSEVNDPLREPAILPIKLATLLFFAMPVLRMLLHRGFFFHRLIEPHQSTRWLSGPALSRPAQASGRAFFRIPVCALLYFWANAQAPPSVSSEHQRWSTGQRPAERNPAVRLPTAQQATEQQRPTGQVPRSQNRHRKTPWSQGRPPALEPKWLRNLRG